MRKFLTAILILVSGIEACMGQNPKFNSVTLTGSGYSIPLYGVLYTGSHGIISSLGPSSTFTQKFLSQTGTAIPSWMTMPAQSIAGASDFSTFFSGTSAKLSASGPYGAFGTSSTASYTSFDPSGAASAAQAYSIQRSHHTGTQSPSTISSGTFGTGTVSQDLGMTITGSNLNFYDATHTLQHFSGGGGGGGSGTLTSATSTAPGLTQAITSGSIVTLSGTAIVAIANATDYSSYFLSAGKSLLSGTADFATNAGYSSLAGSATNDSTGHQINTYYQRAFTSVTSSANGLSLTYAADPTNVTLTLSGTRAILFYREPQLTQLEAGHQLLFREPSLQLKFRDSLPSRQLEPTTTFWVNQQT